MYKKHSKGISMLLVASTIFIIALVMSGCNRIESKSGSNYAIEINKEEKWTEVGEDIFVITSDFYLANMILVTSNDEAILIDTGMNKKDRETIEALLQDRNFKLKNMIITHLHADHKNNMRWFLTKEMSPITPLNAEDGQLVTLGDKTLRIIFTEGHYQPKGHISVELVDENILVAGDILCNNMLPPIFGEANHQDLLNTLESLKEKNYALIIPGHGEIEDTDLIFERQLEYLNNVIASIEELVASGGTLEDALNIKLDDCIEDTSYLTSYKSKEDLEYWHKKKIETIFKQLEN